VIGKYSKFASAGDKAAMRQTLQDAPVAAPEDTADTPAVPASGQADAPF
jgi:myo-inositol-1(or 4)-monophosphatase